MIAIRAAKIVMVAAIALFASLVAFGNLTDYDTNFVFVQHVLSMDTVFASSTIKYRAINNPALHHAAYAIIIATETAIAVLCWIGTLALAGRLRAAAADFNRAKTFAVAGLTLGFLLWQAGFMAIGGEWFGMWQSPQWNGVPSAFRFAAIILAVLIFLAMPDGELERLGQCSTMPTIAYFLGISVRMFFNDHDPPYFHVRYQGFRARVRIADGEVIDGRLPPTVTQLVRQWTALRRQPLMQNWRAARTDGQLERIGGLE